MNEGEALIFTRVEYRRAGTVIRAVRYDYRYSLPRIGEYVTLKGQPVLEVYRIIYREATGTVEIHL